MTYNDQHYFGSSIRIENFKQMVADVIKEELKNIIEQQKENIKEGLKNDTEKPMSIGELATHFGVTKVTIHNWRNRGVIQGVKIGRKRFFQKTEITEALGKCGYKPKVSNGGKSV